MYAHADWTSAALRTDRDRVVLFIRRRADAEELPRPTRSGWWTRPCIPDERPVECGATAAGILIIRRKCRPVYTVRIHLYCIML